MKKFVGKILLKVMLMLVYAILLGLAWKYSDFEVMVLMALSAILSQVHILEK